MNNVIPLPGKTYKIFFVEVDDDNRERVISGLAESIEFSSEPEYVDMYTEYSGVPLRSYMTNQNVTCTLKLVPSLDGAYFRIENFMEEE